MALIFSRTVGKSIMIGDEIKITVTKFRENQVHIAIEAPRDVPVHRQEIYDLIKKKEEQKKGRAKKEAEQC